MYVLECLLILFWALIVPILIGMLIINQFMKESKTDLLFAWVCGFICMMSGFYILVMPMLFLKAPLHVLVLSWSIIVIIFCGISLILNRKRIKDIICHNINQIKKLPLLAVLVIMLIFAQASFVSLYQHEDADDAFYVASATTAIETDTIFQVDPYTGDLFASYPSRYVLSPFPIFLAMISQLVLVHPAIVAHTILPIILIPLSYAIFALLGKKLFPDQPSAVMCFLLFLCVLNVFGNVSIYTNSSFLLFRIWQGKAVLANVILPAIMYFSFRAMTGDKHFCEWMMLFVAAMAACLTSSMGIVLAPIMIACHGFVFAVRNHKIRTFIYSLTCCAPCIACGIASMIM